MERIFLVTIFIKILTLTVTSWIIVCFQSLIMIHFRSFEENLCLDRSSLRSFWNVAFTGNLCWHTQEALIHIWEIFTCLLLPCARSVQEVRMPAGTVKKERYNLPRSGSTCYRFFVQKEFHFHPETHFPSKLNYATCDILVLYLQHWGWIRRYFKNISRAVKEWNAKSEMYIYIHLFINI